MTLRTILTSPTSRNRTLKLAGFTLFELIVVLMIIATMVMVAVPFATRSNKSLKIEDECLSLTEAAKYAADLAADTRRPTRIVVNLKNNSYLLEVATGEDARSYKPIDGFGGNIRCLGQGVRIVNTTGFTVDGSEHCLVFEPTRPWPNASISLSSGDAVKTIQIRGQHVEFEDPVVKEGR